MCVPESRDWLRRPLFWATVHVSTSLWPGPPGCGQGRANGTQDKADSLPFRRRSRQDTSCKADKHSVFSLPVRLRRAICGRTSLPQLGSESNKEDALAFPKHPLVVCYLYVCVCRAGGSFLLKIWLWNSLRSQVTLLASKGISRNKQCVSHSDMHTYIVRKTEVCPS